MDAFAVEALGEEAVLLRFGDGIDAACNDTVHRWAARCRSAQPAWLLDCVPAFASLALFVDRCGFDDPRADPVAVVREWLARDVAAVDDTVMAASEQRRVVEIPVCYDPEFAPDLDALAAHAGLTPDEVIARHVRSRYTVAMIGFAPGFPYLLGLDPALAMPRLATPRTHVAAGSVGIGGGQAGIYPRESPGGWRIIGRTPLCLFDPARHPPALLAPADTVRFVAIDRARFDALAGIT